MSELFRLNASIQKTWQSSLTTIMQILRRVSFVVEDTFSFGDFNPQVNYQGMATTGVGVSRAKYLKIGSLFLFSVDFGATVAAPLTNRVSIIIPYTAKSNATITGASQGGAYYFSNGAVDDAGHWQITQGNNEIFFYRTINFTANNLFIRLNGFLEIQ